MKSEELSEQEFDILIEKIDDDIVIPLGEKGTFQIRADGVMLGEEIHFWEEILTVRITNRGLLKRLAKKK